jgi:hypothetical protein
MRRDKVRLWWVSKQNTFSKMKAPYTIFGQTKQVEVVVYKNNQKIESTDWDEDYWIEIPEDWYGLMASNFKDKKVRIITREEWLRSR